MDEAGVTLEELVARFALRRRAPTVEFLVGVRLAKSGHVALAEVTSVQLKALVSDPDPIEVTLFADEAAGLSGRCACGATMDDVCRHQVAAAHALWARSLADGGQARDPDDWSGQRGSSSCG